MLANAEILEHASRDRLVAMAYERAAVEDDPPSGGHAARQRYGRRVEHDDVHRVGGQMFGNRSCNVKPHCVRVGPLRQMDREIDVAARGLTTETHAPEDVGEIDFRRRCRNHDTNILETLFDIGRERQLQGHP